MGNINIAIDGPSGVGKSTISRAVAEELGFIYVDTGAMYRAAAYSALKNGINIKNENDRAIKNTQNINIDIKYSEQGQQIFLNGENVTDKIRTKEVSIGASDIAVIPEVRLKLVDIQRNIASKNNVIMDGRDIGTYVLPNAQVKIYLTASVEERARRRYEEQIAKNMVCDYESVKKDMLYRDDNDSKRKFAPLKKADDAILLDTTENTFEQSVEAVIKIVKGCL